MTLAAIGLGANLGDPPRMLERAIAALGAQGTVVGRSRLYRTVPWGYAEQPPFCNAVVLLETGHSPRGLLEALKRVERSLGRKPGERWGPRLIDLDILTFGELVVDEPDLRIPHARLRERAFVLVPLAELDPRYAPLRDRLPPEERAGVVPLDQRESVSLMSEASMAERVRALASAFLTTDLVRVRITDPNDDAIELRRAPRPMPAGGSDAEPEHVAPAAPANVEAIKADLVGIVHLRRPAVHEGERLEGDRELAYVEALGIRNAVRSLGPGRIAAVRVWDGQPVEYGQVLFEIDRG